jgi:hypothetical protein
MLQHSTGCIALKMDTREAQHLIAALQNYNNAANWDSTPGVDTYQRQQTVSDTIRALAEALHSRSAA